MIYFLIAICIFYVTIQLMTGNRIYRPAVMLMALWGVVLVVYSIGAFYLPKVSVDTYLIILIGLLAFVVGSEIAKMVRKRVVIGRRRLFSKEINQVVYKILVLIFFAIMLLPAIRSLLLLVGGASLYTIRYSLQNDILGEGVIAILFNYFCEPFLTFLIVYAVANLFSENRKVRNIIFAIVGVVFMTLVSGGRFFILYLIGALGVAFLLYRKSINLWRLRENKKVLKRVKILIVIAIVAIVVVSIFRSAVIGQTIYVYLCGGIPFMEHLNETIVKGDYTGGAATLYGFSRPLFVVLRKVGICNLPVWLQNIESTFLLVDNPYYIAPGILFNSFSTGFFAPYLDGGVIGVGLIFFIMGYIAERVYKRVEINDEYKVSWFLLISLVVILSFFRLLVTHYSFALAFVYLIITHKAKAKLQ